MESSVSRIELAGPPMAARKRMAKQGVALEDGSFPIPDKTHLYKAMQAFGRCPEDKRAALVAHIRRRARALGAVGEERVAQFLKDHAAGTTKAS